MYIPKEIVFFILGFLSFPLLIGVIYQLRQDKKGNKDNGHND